MPVPVPTNEIHWPPLEVVKPRRAFKIVLNGTWVKIPHGSTLHSSKEAARTKLMAHVRWYHVRSRFESLPEAERAKHRSYHLHPNLKVWQREVVTYIRTLEKSGALVYEECLESGSGAA